MQEFVLQPLSSPLGHGGPGPSVYLVDDFVTALEVRELRRHAYECFARKLGAGRSFEQSWLAFDSKPSPVVTDHVGSATCPPGGAAELLALVDERIGRLVGIPPHAAEEPFMLSRQQPEVPTKDAFENLHHDKINEDKERRAATVLVYLSDSDDAEGGHTIFPALPPAAPFAAALAFAATALAFASAALATASLSSAVHRLHRNQTACEAVRRRWRQMRRSLRERGRRTWRRTRPWRRNGTRRRPHIGRGFSGVGSQGGRRQRVHQR